VVRVLNADTGSYRPFYSGKIVGTG
jgi:hypothetical protein